MTVGVILAGGRARRMGGGDKCLLDLAGRPILAHVIERLRPQVDRLAINANGDANRFRGFGAPVLPDSVPGYPGPLAGVLAGLDWAAASGAQSVVSVAADTPFFPETLVEGLQIAADSKGVGLAMAASRERSGAKVRHPTFALWPVALRDDLRQALGAGVRKVVHWTGPHGCAEACFGSCGSDMFFNVNTPGDLDVAQELVRAGVA